MKNHYLLILFFLCTLAWSCTKDDNEALPRGTVSRLYVSNADVDAAVQSTMIFDPADQATFKDPYKFDSKLPDGNGIIFDPFSGMVFQVSRQVKNVKSMRVNTDGSVASNTSFIDESLVSAREIAYDRNSRMLYISSNTDSAIYVYEKVDTLRGTVRANKKLKLNGQPWGIHLDNNRLFVAMDLEKTEVQLFESASSLEVGTITPSKRIIISGAKRLHGITYSPSRDALIVTDIGLATGGSFATDGAVHIIDSVTTRFTTAGANITPLRTITGTSTGLGNPVDVAIDERSGKNLIYIAEKANKTILVFKYSDKDNVAPTATATLTTSPEAIYLDAR